MKKTLFVLTLALLTCMVAMAQVTDTIVSTTPSNRNVLIEEYTGINCGFCPDGHRIANQIKASNPDRVSVINIHQGDYSASTYTTSFGNALANQVGISGYPTGTVNRHVFSGSKTEVDRGQWATRSNQIMNMASPVNIAAEATLDWTTRTLNIRVQLYYTGTQTVSSNALNIALLQDNVLGPQSGMNYNPSQVVGNQYRHMHMLRHLITGQWGETISTIDQGTLVEKTYEYVVPEKLGSPNPIEAVLEDLTLVAFVCEGHQEVLTGMDVPIQHLIPPTYCQIMEMDHNNLECNDQMSASFQIKNYGEEDITSLEYTYTVNGTENTASWTGSLTPSNSTTVNTPNFNVLLNTNNAMNVKINTLNGESVNVPNKDMTIKKNVYSCGGSMLFVLRTDNYGSETSFKLFDPNGNVFISGGPFSNSPVVHEYPFNPTITGCYRLEVYDQYGDGINTGYGVGYFLLKTADGVQIFRDNGKFGSQATYMIDVTYPAGVEEYMTETDIYPNPATDVININTPENVLRVEIFNMQGQLVKAEIGAVNNISVKSLANGLYTLKLTTDNGVSMHKIIKK